MPPDEAAKTTDRPSSTASSEDRYVADEWPKMPDGNNWDGKDLLEMFRNGKSPFKGVWDVAALLKEIESKVEASVEDVPQVYYGSNNYGVNIKLSDHRHVLARLARADVNMPSYDGFSLHWLHSAFDFETTLLTFLDEVPDIPTSPFLYSRRSMQRPEPRLDVPKDISGRQLMLFEMTKGGQVVWWELSEEHKMMVLDRAAAIRARLFNLALPPGFAEKWMLWSTFQPIEWAPKQLPFPVHGTREYCIALIKARVEAIIGKKGDLIGWEDDKQVVTDSLLTAKANILRLISHILPSGEDEEILYRLILQHDDYGIHNMSIHTDEDGEMNVTSIYDWETACIVPFILSEVDFSIAGYDLTIDAVGKPMLNIRMPSPPSQEEIKENEEYAARFVENTKEQTPHLGQALEAGKHARYIWLTLKTWGGDDAEEYFGNLGSWAEGKLQDLGITQEDDVNHPQADGKLEDRAEQESGTGPGVEPKLSSMGSTNSNL